MTSGRYSVKCTIRRRRKGPADHVFRVRRTLGRLEGVDGSPVELVDSGQFDPSGLDHDAFGAVARAVHGDRRDDDRAQKGRLFYVLAGKAVVAFIALHVPPKGPVIVEHVMIDERLAAGSKAQRRVASMLWATLLDAALEASEAAGREPDVLAWATPNAATRDVLVGSFEFAEAKRPKGTGLHARVLPRAAVTGRLERGGYVHALLG